MTSLLTVLALAAFIRAEEPAVTARLSDDMVVAIAYRICDNETGGVPGVLTHWNRGEEFASLGIGHFIWYPEGRRGPFQESFPRVLSYLEEHGVKLPAWLKLRPPCPWPDRRSFFADIDSPRMLELRALLQSTVYLQGRFMADRLQTALPKMLAVTPRTLRPKVLSRFKALSAQKQGLYALVDYVNFKGEGLSPPERYKHRGWGLLQVLVQMRGDPEGPEAVAEFSRSAGRVLARRVRNSPPERRESRWLAGWRKRLRTYLS
ncbi:MAG: hypothetical protein NTX64_13240 [Elusimicrobia bacterium]|nr:hypothetical protein [Elusimicrobiota bacterium]